MTDRIALALAIHNHQPVGNFGSVIAFNHERAYQPLLEALERHPGVRLALHYSGPLLEWLRAERPEFVTRLAALVARDQVEIMGGGYYEPVLASLPEADRVGQLARMSDELTHLFGREPRGAWLAERVWEPDVPTSLVAAGYQWTVLDDAHFRAAAIAEEALWGAYTTDDQGRRLAIFGTEQGLRYRIPFGGVDDVLAYLREHATPDGRRVGMMGDDGEKFGAWPTTWEHCWGGAGWVDRFFAALEANASWLTTVTPSAWLEREPPIGRVYVPTGSYAEMGEWALPAAEGLHYGDVLRRDQAEGRPEPRWMRGGFWRNFQVKYREINDLHKQMLRTSAKVAAMPPGPLRERGLDHLYQGQSNDCYWHGLFGGIYLSHMRLATYAHLIAAEDAADRVARDGGEAVDGAALVDVDLDGVDEVLLSSPGQVVSLKPAEGAGIGSWDVRAPRHALTAVLRRRPEAYHARLVAFEEAGGAGAGEGGEAGAGSSAASIHDLVRTREPGLAGRLHYDDYERRSGLVHLLPEDTTPDEYATSAFRELGDFVDQPFTLDKLDEDCVTLTRDGQLTTPDGPQPVRVRKTVRFDGQRRSPRLTFEVEVHNPGGRPLAARMAVEWSLTLLGGGGNPAAAYRIGGVRSSHDGSGIMPGVSLVEAGNRDVGVDLATTLKPAADAWWYSIDTVSLSEDGYERTHQGSSLTFLWPLRLAAGETAAFEIDHRITTSVDRSAEEGS
ncbi:MAG: alpha-amylase/4-alpha-glucanotransferase domain-containing protein [Candidatus Limnocylindrales bacterium]